MSSLSAITPEYLAADRAYRLERAYAGSGPSYLGTALTRVLDRVLTRPARERPAAPTAPSPRIPHQRSGSERVLQRRA